MAEALLLRRPFDHDGKTWHESDFTNTVWDIARREGYSIANQRHVLGAIVENPTEGLACVFPQGKKDVIRIKASLRDSQEGVEPWLGKVSLWNRTTAIFEEAQKRATQRGGLFTDPEPGDYLVALLREEMRGASDVTELLKNLGISPMLLLRKITDVEGY